MTDTFTDAPKTLTESGQAPETRIGKPDQVRNRVNRLVDADRCGRSQRRALVKGLVDGNPPYRAGDLRNAGRADACNVNWRQAESFLNSARGAFYDVFSETPTFATVECRYGQSKEGEWGRIITEEFDCLLREDDEDFDYEMQISQYEMVLYGCGPLMFEDEHDFCAIAIPHRNLLVPEASLSRANKWEECAVLVDYYAHDLYKRIRSPQAASDSGWNVESVRKAIMQAHPKTKEGGSYASWEWHQQELKDNAFNYSAGSATIQCAHYFVREFATMENLEGGITHGIILISKQEEGTEPSNLFLFKKVRRYEKWRQLVHPMYYDNDGGGHHHSVTGLGVKMYSPMEFQNRLICNSADKTFAPKVFFKPTTANGNEILNIIRMGDYAKVPQGFDAMQIPIGSYIEEGVMFNRELSGMIASNLSQYRQNLSKQTGNPVTATEVEQRASEQARLGKTQLNHYYNQLDWFYGEKFRRIAMAKNKNMPGGEASLSFQKRCKDRGVPAEALKDVKVRATRIVGQGSPFMRQQASEKLLATSQLNPSSAGRENIYRDFVSAYAGQAMVSRYVPEIVDHNATDQMAIAQLQIAAARTGVPPVVSQNQNSRIFAEAFLGAMSQALATLEKGANPQEVYNFIDAMGPATIKHIELLRQDPRNEKLAKEYEKAWKKISQMHDQIGQQLQQMAEKQQEAQQKRQQAQRMMQGQDAELQMKAAEAKAKLAMHGAKTRQDMQQKQQKHSQDLAIADAKSASEITLQHRKAEADITNAARKTEMAGAAD